MTRFFIGENYKEKIYFGIFYDEVSGNYVVYKNKDDGSRTTRYEGKAQIYVVNELYLKLKEEIQNKKIIILEKIITIKKYIAVFIIIAIVSLIIVIPLFIPGRGYYFYNNDAYYYQNGSRYQYDNYEG